MQSVSAPQTKGARTYEHIHVLEGTPCVRDVPLPIAAKRREEVLALVCTEERGRGEGKRQTQRWGDKSDTSVGWSCGQASSAEGSHRGPGAGIELCGTAGGMRLSWSLLSRARRIHDKQLVRKDTASPPARITFCRLAMRVTGGVCLDSAQREEGTHTPRALRPYPHLSLPPGLGPHLYLHHSPGTRVCWPF